MTRSPLTAAVDAATKTVWPEVQRAVEQTFRSMAELAGVEEAALVHVESFVAKNGNGSRRRRTIVGETVWAIARLGLLRTPQDAAVIEAAKAWVAGDGDDVTLIQLDDALCDAVEALPDYRQEVAS